MTSDGGGIPNLADLVSASKKHLKQGQLPWRDIEPTASTAREKRVRRPPMPPPASASDSVVAWLILGKPSIRDQMTLELGARISAAVGTLAASEHPPDIVCFCGGEADGMGGTGAAAAASPVVSSAALAYHYFRAAAEALRIDTEPVRFIIEPHAEAREGVLSVAIALRARLREEAAAQRARIGGADGGGTAGGGARSVGPGVAPPAIRVVVFSTDHQVGRLRDIEALTPRHSPLTTLRDLPSDVCFVHVPAPYAYATDRSAKRQARHVRLAAQLPVLLANLRVVAEKTGCLHDENARRLADVRRALNEALWELVPAHGAQRALYSPLSHGSSASGASSRVLTGQRDGLKGRGALCELECVEAAVGALGRVQEILAPLIADPVHGTVSAAALDDAQELLRAAAASLRLADPDR
jgi:hypothetical protein